MSAFNHNHNTWWVFFVNQMHCSCGCGIQWKMNDNQHGIGCSLVLIQFLHIHFIHHRCSPCDSVAEYNIAKHFRRFHNVHGSIVFAVSERPFARKKANKHVSVNCIHRHRASFRLAVIAIDSARSKWDVWFMQSRSKLKISPSLYVTQSVSGMKNDAFFTWHCSFVKIMHPESSIQFIKWLSFSLKKKTFLDFMSAINYGLN